MISSRLSAVERERDAVRAMLGAERQRAEDMGVVAEAARGETASREMQLQRLRTMGGGNAPSFSSSSSQQSVGAMSTLGESSQQSQRGGGSGSGSGSGSGGGSGGGARSSAGGADSKTKTSEPSSLLSSSLGLDDEADSLLSASRE